MARSKVAILMAVHEDARFLPEQLSSIRERDHEDFEVWVSRDCAGEPMSRVLADQVPRFGKDRFFALAGPGKGCARTSYGRTGAISSTPSI